MRQKFLHNYWFFSVLIVLLMCFGPIFIYIGLVPPRVGFLIAASSVLFAPIAIVHGAWLTWWQNNRAGFTGMYVGVGLLGYLVTVVISSSDQPVINDVATDLNNPPGIYQNDVTIPADFIPKIEEFYGNIKPKYSELSKQAAFERALEVLAEEKKVDIVYKDLEQGLIQFTQTSEIFRFVDDGTIRITSTNEGSYRSRIDMRSRSRVGTTDFGANAVRIKRILNKM